MNNDGFFLIHLNKHLPSLFDDLFQFTDHSRQIFLYIFVSESDDKYFFLVNI